MTNKKPLSYADAGVNIDAGNALVENIKPLTKATHREGVLSGLGGFGALFELPTDRYEKPVLVSCTDGVGTKLMLAQQFNQLENVGIDCVAMCVNDMLVSGAEPLFFLDYYACGKLNVDQATAVVRGVANGCQQAGAALVGGETAELPGLLTNDDFDIAGFCVGVVEKDKIITGETIQTGDALIALPSSGPHSNGYSLIRKILASNIDEKLAESLLAPTKIYVSCLLPLTQQGLIKGMAHITGGGLTENIPRILPENVSVEINRATWEWPEVFQMLQAQGNVVDDEMLRTFNCGVGMVVCVSDDNIDTVLKHCEAHDENAWVIGRVVDRQADNPRVRYSL